MTGIKTLPMGDIKREAAKVAHQLEETAALTAVDLELLAEEVASRLSEEVQNALDAAAQQVATAITMVQQETIARKKAIEHERITRKRNIGVAIVTLLVTGFLATGATLILMAKIADERDAASQARAISNCEVINQTNQGNRELWEGILVLASRADAVFPPEERQRRIEDRAKANALVATAFATKNCSTLRNP